MIIFAIFKIFWLLFREWIFVGKEWEIYRNWDKI